MTITQERPTAESQDKLLDKIIKMTDRANHPGTPEEEVEICTQKIAEWMAEHNLNEQMPDQRRDVVDGNWVARYTKQEYVEGAKASYERTACVYLVEKYFAVTILHQVVKIRDAGGHIREKQATLFFVGKTQNVEIAMYMYKWLTQKFKDLWRNYHYNNRLHGKGDRTAYYAGLQRGFQAKMEAAKIKMEASMAMVLVEDPRLKDAVKEKVGKVRTDHYKLRPRRWDNNVYRDGEKDGKEIEINPHLKKITGS
jgi:hypothetical protein